MSVNITVTLPLDTFYAIQSGEAVEHTFNSANNALITAVNALPRPKYLTKPIDITVKVERLTGKILTVGTTSGTAVYDFKVLIQDKEGFSPDQQRLIFGGRQLEDKECLGKVRFRSNKSRHFCLSNRSSTASRTGLLCT